MINGVKEAIAAIAERSGTSILGLTYWHPTDGVKKYNLRAGDSRTREIPHDGRASTRVSHIAGTGNTILRVIDHNGGEIPKCFNLDRILSLRCGSIRA